MAVPPLPSAAEGAELVLPPGGEVDSRQLWPIADRLVPVVLESALEWDCRLRARCKVSMEPARPADVWAF
jgi:hypothetical protein